MTIWRQLTPEEEKDFRRWARENYKVRSPINELWHPVVQDECQRMNGEWYGNQNWPDRRCTGPYA